MDVTRQAEHVFMAVQQAAGGRFVDGRLHLDGIVVLLKDGEIAVERIADVLSVRDLAALLLVNG